MTSLSSKVITALQGRTLVTAESITGGGIGSALTAVSGSSAVYKGGIICYTNEIKRDVLGVSQDILDRFGAVSKETAQAMVSGARRLLSADIAVSVTGLAGPGGDEFGNPVGTVYIGFESQTNAVVKACFFRGSREEIRHQVIEAALQLILDSHE